MIPYDDLVLALATWRTKQGLPVGSLPPSVAARIAAGEMTPVPRTSPPMAPPKGYGAAEPEMHDDPMDVDDAALLEEAHFENEGDEYAMGYDARPEQDGESTAIGVAPPPGGRDSFSGGPTQSEPTLPDDSRRGGRNRGW